MSLMRLRLPTALILEARGLLSAIHVSRHAVLVPIELKWAMENVVRSSAMR